MTITGIDHIMLAVPDLSEGADELAAALGLPAERHAAHPAFGTANRVVRLPGLHLELITIVDPATADTWHVGRRIADVNAAGGGLLAFVLGVRDLPETVDELIAAGLAIDPPSEGSGVRGDGSTIRKFRLAGHGENFLAGRLPSLIEYNQPGEPDQPPADLGYTVHGLVRVDVAVDDFADGVDRYSLLCGAPPRLGYDDVLGVRTAEFGLPDGRSVRLVGPGVADRQGLFGIALGVADLAEACAATRARGVELAETGVSGELLLEPKLTLNSRITFLRCPTVFED